MRDDDKLRVSAEAAQISGKTLYVPVVQGGVDLVQHTERRWPYLQNCEIQRNGDKGLFTTGKERDGLELLSGWLHTDLNAAGQRLGGFLQLQRRLAAAEHLRKSLPEIGVDLSKFGCEDFRHLFRDILDDPFQIALGGQNVIPLARKVLIALVDTGIFLDCAEVRRAEGGDFPFQLRNALGCSCDTFYFRRRLRRSRARQLIAFPEPVDDLLFLHLRGGFLCFQPGALPLHIQNVAVFALGVLFRRRFSGLDLPALFQRRFQGAALRLGGGRLIRKLVLALFDLLRDARKLGSVALNQRQFLRAVSAHRLLQFLQAPDGVLRRCLFRVQRSGLHTDGSQPFGKPAALFRRNILTVREDGKFLVGGNHFLFQLGNSGIQVCFSLLIGFASCIQRVQFPLRGGNRIADCAEKDGILLFFSL